MIVGGLLHVVKRSGRVLKGLAYASSIGGLLHVLKNSNMVLKGMYY